MPESTQSALGAAYTEALERALAQSLTTEEDWGRFKEMLVTKQERLDAETQDYRQNYLTRLAEARQIILREEHGLDFDHPLPEGVARQSDRQRLDIKADVRVRQDHQRRVTAIFDDHRSDLKALKAEIGARRTRENAPDLKRHWNQSVRRSGPTQT